MYKIVLMWFYRCLIYIYIYVYIESAFKDQQQVDGICFGYQATICGIFPGKPAIYKWGPYS